MSMGRGPFKFPQKIAHWEKNNKGFKEGEAVERNCILTLLTAKIVATLESRRELGRVNFHKDFWDCYWWRGENWPIADRRAPNNDPRYNCGTHFGPSSLKRPIRLTDELKINYFTLTPTLSLYRPAERVYEGVFATLALNFLVLLSKANFLNRGSSLKMCPSVLKM